MPHRLKHRQEQIQEKRKTTPWREFVMEICSWYTFNIYVNNGALSNYPGTDRIGGLLGKGQELENKQFELAIKNSIFDNISYIIKNTNLHSVSHYGENLNSDYATTVKNSKNIYQSSTLVGCENVLYSFATKYSSDIHNSTLVWDSCSLIFNSFAVFRSNEVFYSSNISDSNNIRFCEDMIGCSECIHSSGLKNNKFVINNIQHEEKEYYKIKKDILSKKSTFKRKKEGTLFGYTPYTENVENGFATSYLKDGRNVCFGGNPKGAEKYYDVFSVGRSANIYGCCDSGGSSDHIYCCSNIGRTYNAFYSIHLENCSYCLGCIGLKNKSYCIYNKQYEKDERYDKVDEIFSQMDADGELGKFFPGSMNPFYFNDTAAYLIDPTFTKEEVEAAGYMRRDEPIQVDIPAGVQTVSVDDLHIYEFRKVGTEYLPSTASEIPSEAKRHIDPEILKKVILDHEGNAYRVIPMELEFLVKHGLPLPRKHRLERMKDNFRIG